ncbi:hypothetical protein [Pseudomonas jinjuensis]|uniref:hypothetical protein n=1 Tax=Pseudomonas jinjuensis TaxID=198616 RepID=UPI000A012336|nr:hypothetical protein [Pseudomonas jinjuensis]
MQRSGPEDGRHSTPTRDDVRPRPWLRVFLSLAVFGLLVGLMLGRLFAPEPQPPRLLAVEMQGNSLQLRFDREIRVHAARLDGALALMLDAQGEARQGQGRLGDLPLRWRIQPRDGGLLLSLISTRPLHGSWSESSRDGEWLLTVDPQPE